MKSRLYARGVLIQDGHALVNRTRHGFSLIGGRVGKEEPVEAALRREWLEELGLVIHVGPILSVHERVTGKKNHRVRRIELAFAVAPLVELGQKVPSLERGIEPAWIPAESLGLLLDVPSHRQLFHVNSDEGNPVRSFVN